MQDEMVLTVSDLFVKITVIKKYIRPTCIGNSTSHKILSHASLQKRGHVPFVGDPVVFFFFFFFFF